MVSDWDVMVASLLFIWAAAAVIFLGVLAFTDGPNVALPVLESVAAVVVVVLGILVLDRKRLPRWAPDACAYLLYSVVGLVLMVYGDPTSPAALAYLWLAVHSFYFLPWRRAAPQVAYVAVNYAVSLWAISGPFPVARWLLTVSTVGAISAMVALLRLRVMRTLADLTELTRTDPLTGLLNRRAYDEALDYELARCERTGESLSLVVADLDHFKDINDRYGHQRGDKVLQCVAGVLVRSERRIDLAVRLGGEEFALVLPDTGTPGAHLVAERMRLTLHSAFGLDPAAVTMSLGVATAPDHGETAEELFRAADAALMRAKEEGRDRTVVYGSGSGSGSGDHW